MAVTLWPQFFAHHVYVIKVLQYGGTLGVTDLLKFWEISADISETIHVSCQMAPISVTLNITLAV